MSTLLYFSRGGANTKGSRLSLGKTAYWTEDPGPLVLTSLLLKPEEGGAEAMTNGTTISFTAGAKAIDSIYVSPPLVAGTVIGAGTVKMQLAAKEFAAADNVQCHIVLYLVDKTGGNVRSILVGGNYGSQTEAAAVAGRTNHSWLTASSPASLTSRTALEGDRLVVEVGYVDAAGVTPQGAARYGAEVTSPLAPPYGENETQLHTDTPEPIPWIQFSDNLLFQHPSSLPPRIYFPTSNPVISTRPMKPAARGVVPMSLTAQVAANRITPTWISHFGSTETWKALQPTKLGVLDTSFFDADLIRAKSNGKQGVILRVLTQRDRTFGAGTTSNPAWLFTDASPAGPCVRRAINNGNEYDAYEPWVGDTWQPYFMDMQRKLAVRYDQNELVAGVIVSGFNCLYTELPIGNSVNGINSWNNPAVQEEYDYGGHTYARRINELLAFMESIWHYTVLYFRFGPAPIPNATTTKYNPRDDVYAEMKARSAYRRYSIGDTGIDHNTVPTDTDYAWTKAVTRFRKHFQISNSPTNAAQTLTVANTAVAGGASHLEFGPGDWVDDASIAPITSLAWASNR